MIKGIYVKSMMVFGLIMISGCDKKESATIVSPPVQEHKKTPIEKKEIEKVEIIHGHTLPPEPDETLNNSTLLGIDTNGNGVRDDVERWIYKKYKDKHPIYIDIAMQAARNFKLILLNSHDAKKIHYKATEYIDCKSYYQYYANDFNEKILIKDDFDTEYLRKKIYFNTSDREEKYSQYSVLLSGDSYSLLPIETLKSKCDFNTNKYEE